MARRREYREAMERLIEEAENMGDKERVRDLQAEMVKMGDLDAAGDTLPTGGPSYTPPEL